jgi:hypothetical protein
LIAGAGQAIRGPRYVLLAQRTCRMFGRDVIDYVTSVKRDHMIAGEGLSTLLSPNIPEGGDPFQEIVRREFDPAFAVSDAAVEAAGATLEPFDTALVFEVPETVQSINAKGPIGSKVMSRPQGPPTPPSPKPRTDPPPPPPRPAPTPRPQPPPAPGR